MPPSGFDYKPNCYTHITISTYQHFCKRIEQAATNIERDEIYAEGVKYIEAEFATIDALYSLDKEVSLKIKENLKNVLNEQRARYNTYPRWILTLGKLAGLVPWYIYK